MSVLGRCPGKGNGNALQCSRLENPMDGEAWQATVHGATKSPTRVMLSLLLSKRFLEHTADIHFTNNEEACEVTFRQAILHFLFCLHNSNMVDS